MSRILFGWELGLNFGHLVRLLPLATQLKARGHQVLVATHSIAAASAILGPERIPFIAAPQVPPRAPRSDRVTGYADILLNHGWDDRSVLWGLVSAWQNLFRLSQPDVIILDYAPTAALAARISGLGCVFVGNGFDLPPALSPLPPFPGFSWATAKIAAAAERRAVAHANAVMQALGGPGLGALRDLFAGHPQLLATFPELDHYGARTQAEYVGFLSSPINGAQMDWPQGPDQRVFAYLRPEMAEFKTILASLAGMAASILCVVPGVAGTTLVPYQRPHIRFSSQPLNLSSLSSAHACLSYAAEGTVASFLLKGVPQLLIPHYIEGQLTARRVEELGAGIVLRGAQTAAGISSMLGRLT
ncbi:MAG: glycosyltransferase, partial [Mycobacteriales bacterium]